MKINKTPFVLCLLFFGLLYSPELQAKRWLIGLSGLGGLYKHNQKDWNTLITNSEGASAQHFNSKTQLYWGAQLDFIHLAFSGRFMIGLRYERLKEKVSSTDSSSNNSAHLLYFTDSFYFFPISNGFNMFLRLGVGYMKAKGSYTINSTSSNLQFKGNYFTAMGTGGIEYLFWRVAIAIEAGYRYAVIPKSKISSASGSSFSGFNNGSTLMITSGGSSKKFKIKYTGVFYAVAVKIYF